MAEKSSVFLRSGEQFAEHIDRLLAMFGAQLAEIRRPEPDRL